MTRIERISSVPIKYAATLRKPVLQRSHGWYLLTYRARDRSYHHLACAKTLAEMASLYPQVMEVYFNEQQQAQTFSLQRFSEGN